MTSETSVDNNFTWQYIPDDNSEHHTRRRENLKSHMYIFCLSFQGSYFCRCRDGFTGNGVSCRDVNECLTNNGGCDQNAQCINTEGSFRVKCKFFVTYLLRGATVLVELMPPHIFSVRFHDNKFLQGGIISPTPNLEDQGISLCLAPP
jgi:hypothetical protein